MTKKLTKRTGVTHKRVTAIKAGTKVARRKSLKQVNATLAKQGYSHRVR